MIFRDIFQKLAEDIVKGYKINEFMMLTSPSAVGDLFVDEKSLKPYYGMEDKSAKVLMRKLKNNK